MSGSISAASVEETLKDFWATRPRRPHDGRKIAGVAAGIAQRYQIDPVIVRVAFVAMALCNGAGVLIYLLGWLLLAQADDEVSAAEALLGRGRSSTPTALTVLLGLAVVPATGFFVDGGFTMVGGVLLSVGAIYLLHRGRGQLNRPEPAVAFGAGAYGAEQGVGVGDGSGGKVSTEEQTTERVTPPAWDPLGAAPFAWDLPEPGRPPEPVAASPAPVVARRPGSRVGLATFGASLVVLAGSLVASSYSDWFHAQHVLGLLVAVLGAGMVLGSLRGNGGRGLIWLVVPLSVVGVVLTSVDFDVDAKQMGSTRDKPAAVADVKDRYTASVGEVELDLTALPNSGSVTTAVEVGLGSARVRVPADADVTVNCRTDLGSVRCLGRESDGEGRHEEVTDHGTDGPGGLEVVLDVRTDLGEVEVSRG
ncbi:phage shock protein C (PspC) family protein [Saccharothrix saharensis]|uniref:Phage shock protein C (PspC) family protein n=1 Tax=Saccharothrix saharensis TaxID=571190 RepID=A0A543JI96_9PSEU|nr:PspC domain-containing protein [Saccharothrix saharensis]TQM82592.1 phage shock protein C (PspC) family protein [Saccharothrix saharensis]